jgi:hypothetical protein
MAVMEECNQFSPSDSLSPVQTILGPGWQSPAGAPEAFRAL